MDFIHFFIHALFTLYTSAFHQVMQTEHKNAQITYQKLIGRSGKHWQILSLLSSSFEPC